MKARILIIDDDPDIALPLEQRLAAMGHDVQISPDPIGGAQAILIAADGGLIGGSDPRKDGCALGY